MTETAPASEADIWLARMNIGQHRSGQIHESWTKPKKIHDNEASLQTSHIDNVEDEDFSAMSESGGIGIAPSADDETHGRKKLSDSNQKLLEQLLGKKAANARSKERSPHASASGHAGSKPMPAESKLKAAARVEDSDDEEEMGRASTLSSRDTGRKKVMDAKMPAFTTAGEDGNAIVNPDVDPPNPREDPATVVEMVSQEVVKEDENEKRAVKKTPKRKATSYLDEMLAKKKSKGKKKNGVVA